MSKIVKVYFVHLQGYVTKTWLIVSNNYTEYPVFIMPSVIVLNVVMLSVMAL
jgi:hypothetical protein